MSPNLKTRASHQDGRVQFVGYSSVGADGETRTRTAFATTPSR